MVTPTDLEGFYDHISLRKLFKAAGAWRYPLQSLAMDIGIFLAPRALKAAGWTTQFPIVPGRSVMTGHRNGNHCARLATYTVIRDLHYRIPRLRIGQWVDDITLRSVG